MTTIGLWGIFCSNHLRDYEGIVVASVLKAAIAPIAKLAENLYNKTYICMYICIYVYTYICIYVNK